MGLLNEVKQEVKAKEAKKNSKAKSKTADIRYCLKSLELLVEAAALAVVSGFAIYQGVSSDLPQWGQIVIVGAGSLIALRAFVEFVKFLNRRG